MLFGLMALLGAMSPDILQAQLRNHNIWSIGDRGYVMDFKQYPPRFYKPTQFNTSFNQCMSYLTDSAGDFYLGVKLNGKQCGERIVNRYLQADSAFPNYEKCNLWYTFMLQMPDYHRSSILRYYDNLYYTKKYPYSFPYLMNFNDDSSRFYDTTMLFYNYNLFNYVDNVIYTPDCSKIFLYGGGSNKRAGFPEVYFTEMAEVVNGKCVRRVMQSLKGSPTTPGRAKIYAFSPDLSHCILSGDVRGFGVHRFDREKMLIDPESLMLLPNPISGTLSYSLNGRKLYYIHRDTLYQADITVLHKDSIKAQTIAIRGYQKGSVGSPFIHLLPTGQLLVGITTRKYPDIIPYPDREGLACGYEPESFYIPWDSIDQSAYNGFPIDSFDAYNPYFTHQYYIPFGAYYNPGVRVLQGKTACVGIAHLIKADYYRDFIRLRWKITGPDGRVLYETAGDSLRFTPGDTGTYNATVYYRWSCNLLDSSTSSFRAVAIQTPARLPDTLLCTGARYVVGGNAFYGQLRSNWYRDGLLLGSGDSLEVKESGTYRRQLVYTCKVWEDTFTVNYLPEPQRPVDEMYVICKSRNSTFITVNPPPSTQVLWSTGARGRILEVDTPGNYWVNLKNRCYDSTWQFRVREEIPGYTLLIPNAFSPNGDALNETFQITGLEELESYRCEIYNRWGEMVFSTTDKKTFWDGTYQGRPAPKGVYIYVIRGKSVCSITDLFKGVFHLL
ncbi:MAG: hypothetical protein RLZZ370_294 [Bacteroidota bacterium]